MPLPPPPPLRTSLIAAVVGFLIGVAAIAVWFALDLNPALLWIWLVTGLVILGILVAELVRRGRKNE